MTQEKKKKSGKDAGKDAGKKYPSRDKLKYVYIPKDYWLSLQELGQPAERSVSYLVKKAVEAYLRDNGKLPPKPD